MEEVWKSIFDYSNYKISNLGRIRSLKKYKILKQSTNRFGYKSVSLHKFGTSKTFAIHRLVAKAFIPNPNNYPCVNHKDENPSNNCVSNLEWCTYQYNSIYGTAIERRIKTYKDNTDKRKQAKLSAIIILETFEIILYFLSNLACDKSKHLR